MNNRKRFEKYDKRVMRFWIKKVDDLCESYEEFLGKLNEEIYSERDIEKYGKKIDYRELSNEEFVLYMDKDIEFLFVKYEKMLDFIERYGIEKFWEEYELKKYVKDLDGELNSGRVSESLLRYFDIKVRRKEIKRRDIN